MDVAEAATFVLIFLAALFTFMGVWLVLSQRGETRQRIRMRLKGVRQIQNYEMGDTLAEAREREAEKNKQRKQILRKRAFSDIPALDGALHKASWAEKLDGLLMEAQLSISVSAYLMVCFFLAALGAAVSVLWRRQFDPFLALLFAMILGGSPTIYVWLKSRSRLKRFNSQLPDALDLMSSSVKSGQSLNAAIQNVADEMPEPINDEFSIMADELSFGVPFSDVVRHLTDRMNTPDVRFFASSLMIQKETGGNLSEVLDGLQNTIRERFRIMGRVKTLTAQGRLSGVIVGLLPLVLCGVIYLLNPSYMVPLFTDPTGQKLVMFAVVWQLIGAFFIYKIVNIKV
ncbi:MAG: type II secretion system F family protein [Planctomycetes bacterium]|nr:type II secretion system F family protein [Planctomycetota bacterium]